MPHPNAHDERHPKLESNSRLGLALFAVYVALYAGFIYLAVARPETLAAAAFAGVNVAIAYGLGLIAAAIVLAVVYVRVRRD